MKIIYGLIFLVSISVLLINHEKKHDCYTATVYEKSSVLEPQPDSNLIIITWPLLNIIKDDNSGAEIVPLILKDSEHIHEYDNLETGDRVKVCANNKNISQLVKLRSI